MKRMNKRGFTLIELLAVIIILALLIAVAVPAVTRYLDNARKDTYVENIKIALKAVVLDVETGHQNASNVSSGTILGVINYTDYTYNINEINKLLDKKLLESPFGEKYQDTSFIKVRNTNSESSYTSSVCILDEGGNGISSLSYVWSDISDPSKFDDEMLKSGNTGFTLTGSNANATNLKRDRILKGFTKLRCS